MNLAGLRSPAICVRRLALILRPLDTLGPSSPTTRRTAARRAPNTQIYNPIIPTRVSRRYPDPSARPHLHPSFLLARSRRCFLPRTVRGPTCNVPLFVLLFVVRTLPRRSPNLVAFWVLSSSAEASVVQNAQGSATFARRYKPYAALSGNLRTAFLLSIFGAGSRPALRVPGEVRLSLARSWQMGLNSGWGSGAGVRWLRWVGMDVIVM
ncbi:hypothetical protein C8T65DRAFT_5922 [Cerioporus squamosus]|nr:hypothetical protein C8T65DRAFT_5922 [Cerioporus squamosus]